MKKISNPLTIIAIFAGVSEAFATGALAILPVDVQKVFVYFVMLFPTMIVVLFFLVLYFKNWVLYAPSDYENQDHYVNINQETMKSSVMLELQSFVDKIKSEGANISNETAEKVKESIAKRIDESSEKTRKNQIKDFLYGNDGTCKEIAHACGIHPSYAQAILKQLEQEGFARTSNDHAGAKTWSLALP